MFEIRTLVISIFVLVMLAACKPNLSSSYLLQHPIDLQKALEHCRSIDEKTTEEEAECSIVKQAAIRLVAIINDQREDPEQFGQQILQAQIACVKAKEDWNKAQQANHAINNLKQADKNMGETYQIYQDKCETGKVMLAVVGMNSPE